MQYEVEQKYRVVDMAAFETALVAHGATISEPHPEADVYYAHPLRDFATTDEALRIRHKGTSYFITYKGPKIDKTTKTRRELELPLTTTHDTAASWHELLELLGFTPVAEVRKQRRMAKVAWQGQTVEATLDNVERVGTYAELELITDDAGLDAARACIASLAESLGLIQSERRSYLELLLEG